MKTLGKPMEASECLQVIMAWQKFTGREDGIKVSSHPTSGAQATVDAHELYQVLARLQAAERALHFYADEGNYCDRPSPPETGCSGDGPAVLDDDGEKARDHFAKIPRARRSPTASEQMAEQVAEWERKEAASQQNTEGARDA